MTSLFVCFLILCSLWPLRNQRPPPVSIFRSDEEELQLSPACLHYNKKTKLFESDKVVNFSPSWKTQNFCECWKARRLLLVELLTVKSSLFSCNFQTLLSLCSTSHCFVRLSKEKQLCRHLPSPSSFLPLPRSSTGTLCHLTAPAHHSCCLQHSPLLIQSSFFVWAALRNHLFSIYFIAIWAFSDLFPHLFPPILILSFLFHCGGCF